MLLYYSFPVLSIISALIQIIFFHLPVVETFLANILFFAVGLSGILAAFGHIFNSDAIAVKIGWPKGNLFQMEVGFANLAYGIAGVMSMWFRHEFWIALISIVTVFYWGAGIVHIIDLRKNKNKAEFNAGFPLYKDFILPIVLIVLLLLYLF